MDDDDDDEAMMIGDTKEDDEKVVDNQKPAYQSAGTDDLSYLFSMLD